MDQLKKQKTGKFFQLRLKPKTKKIPETVAQNRRFRLPRWLPYGLAGVGLATVVALAFRPAPLAVDVGQVTQGPLQVTIDAEGKTQVKDRYVVAAPVDGRLLRIDLEAGDPVKAESVVAQIDPLPLNTQVQAAQSRLQALRAELTGVDTQRPKSEELTQAEARLRSAEATQQAAAADVAQTQAALEQASRDRNRAQDLETSGAISRQAREAAELEETRLSQALKGAQRELEVAIADVAAARRKLFPS